MMVTGPQSANQVNTFSGMRLDRWMALHGLADRPPRRHRGRRQGIGNRERARLDLFFGASVDDDHLY